MNEAREKSSLETLALETTQLTKRYGKIVALQDRTLALPAGRVAALVGPNGAGKTTLLHLCAGLLEPTAGDVRVFGHSARQRSAEMLPRLSFVAQDHPLYKNFTAADLLTMGRR
jgi:ABC-2 type transport system ATP-binding protein